MIGQRDEIRNRDGDCDPANSSIAAATRLSVIIPSFNEAATIRPILERVASVREVSEIIVVDDGSTDGTRQLLRAMAANPRIKIFFQERNQGKGASIRMGLRHVTGNVMIIQDADLEYDPADYSQLLARMAESGARAVYGSRYLRNPRAPSWHTLGNKILTLFSNVLTGQHLTDMETCYKLMRTDTVRGLALRCDRFGFEPEVTSRLAARGISIYEVPIRYTHRSYEQGKKIGLWDAFKTVAVIILEAFRR